MASSSPTSARVVVMASGSGSNFQALLDGLATKKISNAQITRLFVNRKTAYAVTRAEKAGVPSEYFNMVAGGFQPKGEKDPEKLKEARTAYDAALAKKVLAEKPDLVVLAGWMHVFTEAFLTPVGETGVRVINLHPALPGKSSTSISSLLLVPCHLQSANMVWLLQANTTEPEPSNVHSRISRPASSRTIGRASWCTT